MGIWGGGDFLCRVGRVSRGGGCVKFWGVGGVGTASPAGRSVEVKDLFERQDLVVCWGAGWRFEEGSHLALPTFIDGMTFDVREGGVEIRGFDVADEQAVGAEE